jgi:hypothetical protein
VGRNRVMSLKCLLLLCLKIALFLQQLYLWLPPKALFPFSKIWKAIHIFMCTYIYYEILLICLISDRHTHQFIKSHCSNIDDMVVHGITGHFIQVRK